MTGVLAEIQKNYIKTQYIVFSLKKHPYWEGLQEPYNMKLLFGDLLLERPPNNKNGLNYEKVLKHNLL